MIRSSSTHLEQSATICIAVQFIASSTFAIAPLAEPSNPSISSETSGGPSRAPGTATVAEDDWRLHGRTNSEQRFSPLAEIDATTVKRLGLAWSYATGSRRGLEATPLVIDGLLYATSTWSEVFAAARLFGSKSSPT